MNLLSPGVCLWTAGAALVCLGAAGFMLPAGGAWESVTEIVAGLFVASVAVLMRRKPKALKWLAVLAGIVALFSGIHGFLGGWAERGESTGPVFLDSWILSDLPGPLDSTVLVLYSAWALWCAFRAPRRRDTAGGAADPQEGA